MADRRAHLRFQFIGSTAASVVATERLRVINVGLSGALVESAIPFPTNAECRVQLVLQGHVSEATAKVRRVTRIAPGSLHARYGIGLEFLSLSPEAEDIIATIVPTPKHGREAGVSEAAD